MHWLWCQAFIYESLQLSQDEFVSLLFFLFLGFEIRKSKMFWILFTWGQLAVLWQIDICWFRYTIYKLRVKVKVMCTGYHVFVKRCHPSQSVIMTVARAAVWQPRPGPQPPPSDQSEARVRVTWSPLTNHSPPRLLRPWAPEASAQWQTNRDQADIQFTTLWRLCKYISQLFIHQRGLWILQNTRKGH